MPEGDWDAVVVGAGPAGLGCAAALARFGRRVLVLEKERCGGTAGRLPWIENFPGFPLGITGSDLSSRLLSQALRWGATVVSGEVRAVGRTPGGLEVRTRDLRYRARTVCIATGTAFRRLGIPGERRLSGRGVSHGPGGFDEPVEEAAVIGGGEAAAYQAVHLARVCRRVHLICRSGRPKANGRLMDRLAGTRRIALHPRTRPLRFVGVGRLRAVRLEGPGGRRELRVERACVLVGQEPNLPRIPGGGAGLYVAGNARGWTYRQAACSAADGLRIAMDCDARLGGSA